MIFLDDAEPFSPRTQLWITEGVTWDSSLPPSTGQMCSRSRSRSSVASAVVGPNVRLASQLSEKARSVIFPATGLM